MKEFNPTDYGWVSITTPPVNHNDVVVLIYDTVEEIYSESIGFFEDGKWYTKDGYSFDSRLIAWFPYPYTPQNN